MKKILTISLLVLVLGSKNMIAQTEQFRVGELDPYFSAYMEPFAKAMAVSMSGGWTHTANVHSTLGFDVTFSASMVHVPGNALTFEGSSLTMPGYTISGTMPTISADNSLAAPNISKDFETPLVPDLTFAGMKGLNIAYGGMAAIQAAVGLPKGTEIILRFIPDISKSTNNLIPSSVDIALEKTGMWGIGVKHDIKQWIPVVSKVPFLQISGLFNYSKMYTGFSGGAMRLDPERLGATSSSLPETTWDNQKFDINMSSFNGSLLIGASIPVFQPFIGVGFSTSSFDGGLLGNYPIIDVVANPTDPTDYMQVNSSETDPLKIEAKVTNFNFQAGARLKMGPIVVFYTWTTQEYSMNSFGLAVTLR